MQTFKQYVEKVDESLLSFLGFGDGLPKDITPEEKADYQNYRKAQMGHEEALKHALRFRAGKNRSLDDRQATWDRGGFDRGTYYGK